MKRPYLQLLVKEMRQAAGTALVFTLLIVGWLAFLATRVGVWPPPLPFALAMIPLGFVPFWSLWRTFYSLRQEWNGDNMYLLLSLPIPGWYITSTKIIVALMELFIYSVIITTGAILMFGLDGSVKLPLGYVMELMRETAVVSTAVKLTLIQLASLLIGMLVIQFSYLFSRLVSRRRGLMLGIVAVVSSWLVFRTGAILSPLLKWIPDITLHSLIVVNDTVRTEVSYLGVAPILGSVIGAFLLFILGSAILERDVEL